MVQPDGSRIGSPTGSGSAADRSIEAFIAGMPKAELHVHHVGSASPRIVADLAARHAGNSKVPTDPAALAEFGRRVASLREGATEVRWYPF